MDATKDTKEDLKKEELIQEVMEAPVEDVKPAEGVKSTESVKSTEDVNPTEDAKSIKDIKPTEDFKPVEDKPAEDKPAADEKSIQQEGAALEDKTIAAPSPDTSVKDTPVEVADPPISDPPTTAAAASTATPSDATPSADASTKSPEAAAATVTAAAITAAAAAAKEVVAEAAAAPPVVAPETSKTVQVDDDDSDPDEDDLDDLDDMLDEFSAAKIDTKIPVLATPGSSDASKKPAVSEKQPAVEDEFSEEEFAKQLQAGMADLLGELEGSPDMQSQFEDIFKQIAAAEGGGDAPATPPPNAKAGAAPQPSTEDASFQETIRKTMERMQASGDQATAAAASGAGDDFMSEMLKQMSSGGLGDLGGEGSEEEFSKMLMGMMEQLTNKEILYEPMKELNEKFPEWLKKNREKTPKDDLKRYEEQQSVVREIVSKFEEKTYSDANTADREFIVERMQKMQAAGSPPADLVGDMPSAQEALNPSDEACNPQ